MVKSGFTLIETLFALAIIALMLPALYTLQTSLLRNMVTARQEYDRLCGAFFIWEEEQIKKSFIQKYADDGSKKEEPKLMAQKLQDFQGDIVIESLVPAANSALAPFKGIVLDRMTISWKGITGASLSQALVGLHFSSFKEEI